MFMVERFSFFLASLVLGRSYTILPYSLIRYAPQTVVYTSWWQTEENARMPWFYWRPHM